jgi:uncharacterized membrane protein
MQNAKFNEIRAKSVQDLQEALRDVEFVDVPAWLITILIIPVYLWELLKMTLRFAAGTVVGMVVGIAATLFMPFMALYHLLDALLVMTWFFKHILWKMTERK